MEPVEDGPKSVHELLQLLEIPEGNKTETSFMRNAQYIFFLRICAQCVSKRLEGYAVPGQKF